MQENPQRKATNRTMIVIAALLIQLCLGALYAWSVFTPKLVLKSPNTVKKLLEGNESVASAAVEEMTPEEMRMAPEGVKGELFLRAYVVLQQGKTEIEGEDLVNYVDKKTGTKQLKEVHITDKLPDVREPEIKTFDFSKTQTQIIFSVSLGIFAVVMVLAGRWQAKSGPRIVALLGGIVFGAGYILAGFFGKSFPAQIIFIGVVAGAGIGLTYVCPVAVGMKWFPDKKGLITGLAVAGFGFGALIWIKLAGSWGNLIVQPMDVLKVFWIYGIIFAALVVFGSIWMVNPPAGWKPPGWKPNVSQSKSGSISRTSDFLPRDILRSSQFYGLWIMFVFSSMAGLVVIGNIKLFAIDALQQNMTRLQASAVAGTAMAVFYSIANGLGRIIWGTISDKTGRKTALALMCIFQGIMMFVFFWMGGSKYLLYLAAAIIGFNFGGNFSLFPTMTADLFGTTNVGRNYGWVFSAYGVGGIIGPIMAGYIRDSWDNWLATFIICGVACLVAAVISLTLKHPKALPSQTGL